MNVLFYDDSPVFGGHEVMTLLGVKKILTDTPEPVHFFVSAANTKLVAELEALARQWPSLTIELLPWHSSKLEALRNRMLRKRIHELALRFDRVQPRLVVAVQGNIEHSSLALLAAKKAGIPSTSYIPVPHTHEEMGAKFGSIRDLFCRYLFRVPDSFITITDEMAVMLKKRGAKCPIHIVYNGVDTTRFQPGNQHVAGEALGLPQDRVILGMVGRLEFKQKQQDLLTRAIASKPSLRENCHLVFAGDGPDKDNLQILVNDLGVSATLLPWTDPAGLYPALNALIIPSRYEGLPLVMLEALACGIAVLASDRDGMKDILHPAWRFTPNDSSAMATAIEKFIKEGKQNPSDQLGSRIRGQMSLESFGNSFSSTVFKLA